MHLGFAHSQVTYNKMTYNEPKARSEIFLSSMTPLGDIWDFSPFVANGAKPVVTNGNKPFFTVVTV